VNADEIASLTVKLEEVCSALNQANVVGPCTNGRRCLKQGATSHKRGYAALDPRKMCPACEAYWFADMARLKLQQLLRQAA
jgi:hypothetical protein